MATKHASGGIIRDPITVEHLVGLAEAAQMLQAMLIDALATLDPHLEVPVSAAWRTGYSRLGGIKIGRGCDCSAGAAARDIKEGPKPASRDIKEGPKPVSRGIKIGRDC